VCLLILGTGSVAGCGHGRGTLTGKIRLDNAPLKVANIAVYSEDGQRSAMGTVTGDDGTYLVKNAPAGPVKIAVVVPSPKEIVPLFPDPNMTPEIRAQLVELAKKAVPIPLTYANPERSNLRTTVAANRETVYDIELKQ
jgi:hypothetical protein